MNIIQKTALTLTIIGGINWLLVGIFKFDLAISFSKEKPERTCHNFFSFSGYLSNSFLLLPILI